MKSNYYLIYPIYLIILFLYRIPPFYIFPLIKTVLFTSHTIASLVSILLFGSLLFIKSHKTKKKTNSILEYLIIFYVITQSISVVYALNIAEFVRIYKNVILAMIIFILTIRLINNNKSFYTVARIFFISSILNIVVQLIVYFKPQPEYSILLNIIYEPLVKEIQTGEYHGRFFAGFFYDGALLAFTYFYLFLKSKSKLFKIFYIIWTTAIFFIAQISNFRIVLVVALMSLFGSLLIHFQKKVVLLLIVIFIGLYIGNVISTTFYSSSSLGRLLFTAEDSISTITTRIELWKKAVNIWSYSPIIGIGLGNYYDFLDSKKTVLTLSEEKNNLIKGTMQHPHNIFFASLVETGLLGLLSIILLLVYLGVSDIQLFFKADKEVKYIIISYWVLFISSMTGPRTAITYLGLLWLLRGLIINKTSILDIKNHGEVNKA